MLNRGRANSPKQVQLLSAPPTICTLTELVNGAACKAVIGGFDSLSVLQNNRRGEGKW